MVINILAAKCIGIDAVPVTVEVDISKGLGVHLVGLADVAVKESLLRTMTAIQCIGYKIPGKKIVINLAPADIHKKGGGYDLSIALGIIAASGQLELPYLGDYIIMGELGLDASIREIQAAIPIAELCMKIGLKGCIFPRKSAMEACDFYNINVLAVDKLEDVIDIVAHNNYEPYICHKQYNYDNLQDNPDNEIINFNEIIGQDFAKRGLEIAAAGGHNAIMLGAPGSGKSSLAKALASILPTMSKEEAIITSKIYSVAGIAEFSNGLMRKRPFRSPHYSASMASIIGGGNASNILPGEISLAQNGILFLDEFTQIPRNVSEALRAPLEDRKVSIARLRSRIEYPASFMLIAAANPCPCGYYGDNNRCICSAKQRLNYLSKLSGPIMDRIDIQLWIYPVDAKLLVNNTDTRKYESSQDIAKRVAICRNIQRQRFINEDIFTNAQMNNKQIEQFCPISNEGKELMEKLISKRGLSARAYKRILKLARSIADLEMAQSNDTTRHIDISPQHLLEASNFRFLDKEQLL